MYGTHLDAKYGTSANPFSDKLIKLNVESGQALKWVGKAGQFPSEPIFIARPDAQNEDDGVVVSIVLDTTLSSPKSFLLVLDAASFHELARVEVPAALPFTIFFGLALALCFLFPSCMNYIGQSKGICTYIFDRFPSSTMRATKFSRRQPLADCQ